MLAVALFAVVGLAWTAGPAEWRPVLERLPAHLVPPYPAEDLPPLAMTVLAAAGLLAAAGCRLLRRGGLRSPGPEESLDAGRETLLRRVSTGGVVLGLLLASGSLVYADARSIEAAPERRSGGGYAEAVRRLGSEKAEVRLAAIHTLRRLAHESERDRVTTADVMAAYVREHGSAAPPGRDGRPAADVQTALTVLGSVYDVPDAGHDWVCGCDLARVRVPGAELSGLNLGVAVLAQADLRGARLSGTNLDHADLTRADLRGALLDGADLPYAVLFMADLGGADLRGADLRGADLFQTDLGKAALRRADLRGVDLFDADLRGADLRGADLTGASLSGADVRAADLRTAILRGADLKRANLKDADLTDADLSGADLSSADLTGADLTGADLTGADLTGVRIDGRTKLPPGARIGGAAGQEGAVGTR
ncbi:Secreted effector protein pipB2 [Nonomuraea coxensis DSM 45129]|uniref:Secreted effector protein pipB2 n=1 Tax=Nonomuraea coxensis DSM 45129 TaxID=1122611 RepID=A0ABX8U362_9ACTN|nr:Secreted effector protein pipB2 [Nonomuraea coxensis DSM 45129]